MRSKVLRAVVVVAMVVVGASCGTTEERVVVDDGEHDGAGPPEADADYLARAAQATTSTSFRWQMEGRLGVPDGFGEQGESLEDLTEATGFGATSGSGEVDAEGDARTELDAGFGTAEVVVVDGELFQRSSLMADGQWIHASELDAATRAGLQGGTQQGVDGTSLVEQLESLDGEVEDLGGDDLDGVTVSHLRATTNAGEAVAAQVPEELGAPDDLAETFASLGDLILDVYVDEGGLVRRISSTFAGSTISIDYFDFGADIAVEAPEGALELDDLDLEQLQQEAMAAMEEQVDAQADELLDQYAPVTEAMAEIEEQLSALDDMSDEDAYVAVQQRACDDPEFVALAADFCTQSYAEAMAAEQEGG